MFNDKFKNSEYNYIINYKNLGFIKTVNLGINCVLGDVIILNSDTLVFSNWVYRMLSYKKDNNVASITPLSNSASPFSFPIQNKDQ
jgi:GT2 family glycosyltransferase